MVDEFGIAKLLMKYVIEKNNYEGIIPQGLKDKLDKELNEITKDYSVEGKRLIETCAKANNSYDYFHSFIALLKEIKETKEILILSNTIGYFYFMLYNEFKSAEFLLLAEYAYKDIYKFLNDYELEKKERIHKGLILHQLGWIYRKKNNVEKLKQYTLFAFIEDIVSEIEKKISTCYMGKAYLVLKTEFFSQEKLDEIVSFVRKNYDSLKDFIYFPESFIYFYSKEKNKFSFLNSFNKNLLNIFSNWIKNSKDNNEKGLRFEDCCTYLLSTLDQINVIKNINVGPSDNILKEYQIDIAFRNNLIYPFKNLFGEYVLCECKNTTEKVNSSQLNHFLTKLIFHNCKFGIIFSVEGTTGDLGKICKLTKIKAFHHVNISIIEILKKELDNINSPEELLDIIIEKYEKIRFDSLE